MMTALTAQEQALLQLADALRDQDYRFTTVTPATHARVNARSGNEWAQDLRGVFGWSRPFAAERVPPRILELMQEAEVIEPCGEGWRSLLRASTLREQLFFHSAYPTDAADAVFFGPDTYRFANVIDSYLERRAEPVRRAVDIGCGAGPGAVLVSLARPEAEVFGVDINDAALSLTRVNAASAGAPVLPRRSDLLRDVEGHFDLIIANPPYLNDPGERAYRHGGGPLGAGLSHAIVDAALPRLAPGGALLLYTGVAMLGDEDPFWRDIQPRLPRSSFEVSYREMDPDVFGEELLEPAYARAERIAAVVLTVRKNPDAS